MLKVVAKMAISAENIDKVIPLASELVAATVKEDGCINYNFCHSTDSPESYAIIETWESKEALDLHMQSEHFTGLVPQISSHIEGEFDIAVFEVLL